MPSTGVLHQASEPGTRKIWGPISVEVPSRDRKLIRLSAIEDSLNQLVPPTFDHGFFTVNHDDALVVGRIDTETTIDPENLPEDSSVRAMVEDVTSTYGHLPTGFLEVTDSMASVFPRLEPVVGEMIPFAGGTIRSDNRIGEKTWTAIQEGDLDAFSIAGVSFDSEPIRWCDDTGCMILQEVSDLDLSSVTIASSTGEDGPFGSGATTMNPGASFVPVQQAQQDDAEAKPVTVDDLMGLITSETEFLVTDELDRTYLVTPHLAHDGDEFPAFTAGYDEEEDEEEVRQQVRDEASVCGDLWFNGTKSQRGAFGNGTEGRSRSDHPPEAWWDSCLSTIGQADTTIHEACLHTQLHPLHLIQARAKAGGFTLERDDNPDIAVRIQQATFGMETTLPEPMTLEDILNLVANIQQGNVDEARTLAESAGAEDPDQLVTAFENAVTLKQPKAVEDCVESILDDNPDMDTSQAYAICNAMHEEGKLEEADISTTTPGVRNQRFGPKEESLRKVRDMLSTLLSDENGD